MRNSIIQSYYKRNNLNHIEELIMRVTNYAWSEMTLTQQNELRETAAAELAAMQARIEKLEALQTIAEDVNTWLIKNKLGGTAHQRSLAEALYALKGDK